MQHGNRNLAPERPAQHDPYDRRKNEGWKRLTIWLTPQEADILQTLGSAWLEGSVKALLAEAIAGTERSLPRQALTAVDPSADPATVLTGNLAAAVLAERGRTIAILFRLGDGQACDRRGGIHRGEPHTPMAAVEGNSDLNRDTLFRLALTSGQRTGRSVNKPRQQPWQK